MEYVPQTDEYLRSDPADAMVSEFQRLLRAHGQGGEQLLGAPVLSKCQRWGAAFCDPGAIGATDAQAAASRAELAASLAEAERERRVTLCGDFLVQLGVDGRGASGGEAGDARGGGGGDPFAIQNAGLSGIRAAERILARSARAESPSSPV